MHQSINQSIREGNLKKEDCDVKLPQEELEEGEEKDRTDEYDKNYINMRRT